MKEKQKKDKWKTKETVSGRYPTTSATSSSPTDLERLDANVSSKDGLRKPRRTATMHECLPPESLTRRTKPCLNAGIQSPGPPDPPTQRPHYTPAEPPPDSSPLSLPA